MKKILLIKYGEIALRGGNRKIFENQLLAHVQKNLEGVPNCRAYRERGHLAVENPDGDLDADAVMPLVLHIFGIVGVARCTRVFDTRIDAVCKAALGYMQETYGNTPLTFKVDTRRSNKAYPMVSQEVSAYVGEVLLDHMPHLKVDVKNPQVVLRIDIGRYADVYANVVKGLGGLPAGSAGKGVLLLSGGIDSPVAGFMMAKRGVALTAVYFDSPPYTSERAKEKVIDLAKRLALYTGQVKLYVTPFTETQLRLYDKVPPEKLTILLKRAMLKAAGMIAEKENASCLITGDSVGQVASQTLRGLLAMESAAQLPVMRPLCGMDKQEITDIAVKIGTFEISIRPYEDCCTIFVAPHPETKPKRSIIESVERNIAELNEMLERAVENAQVLEFGL